MGGHKSKSQDPEETARVRVEAVWHCVGILRPDLLPIEKQRLAEIFLELSTKFEANRRPTAAIQILPAQIASLVYSNLRCLKAGCPVWLSADQLAAELNLFFSPKELEFPEG